ncbi:MAG: hypothetical protein GXP36_05945 [Actinobacteria bacterium]|nr:hypothetical protein [Actinomycetota bacterium]
MAERDDLSRGLWAVVRAMWSEIGPAGKAVLVALAMSAVVALVLGVAIPRQVERHLIDAEIRKLSRIVGDMADAGVIPTGPAQADELNALDEAVRLNLLGSDTVRVKVWLADGTILYSDEPALVGAKYPLSEERIDAFNGINSVDIPNLSLRENEFERGFPPLRELYVPVADDSGSIEAVFEVYHLAEPIETTVGNIQQLVWASITVGIGSLAIFTASLILVYGRAIANRRRLAEKLFGELVRSQAEERTRIIGSLHDDIGQTLYRIHYGIEDLRSRVDADNPVAGELAHIGELVNEVDGSLRAELRSLQYGTGEELALGSALDELAEVTEMETNLSVSVHVETDCELSPPTRIALYRAAREAMTNVRKHSLATTVEVRVQRQGDQVRLQVLDDGVGIIDDEGLGLTTTRERLEAIGGGLKVKPDRRGGTRFSAWVPASECEVET